MLFRSAIVQAFGVASGVLSQMSASGAAMASTAAMALSSPPVLVGTAILAVAAGTYCYFHGIPVPIEAALSSAGLGTASTKGFVVSLPQLAVALILLGGAGYLTYKFYKNRRSLKIARFVEPKESPMSRETAEAVSVETFGEEPWTEFGAAAWAKAGSIGDSTAEAAREAFKRSVNLAEKLTASAVQAGRNAADAAYSKVGVASSEAFKAIGDATSDAGGRFSAALSRVADLIRRKPRKT